MIRINLLPSAKQKRTGAASASNPFWAAIYLFALLAWALILGGVYYSTDSELEEKRAANAALERAIERTEAQGGELEELEKRLEKSRQLQQVVDRLQRARQGPARVLAELSQILSVGGGPTIDEDELEAMRHSNPRAGYDPGWDVRRLWLTSFEEKQRECRIEGRGKTNEDVAEFLRRLALSQVFDEVTLERTSAIRDNETDIPVIQFELTCKVNY